MSNFKRGKPKQSVRCTLCTQARWRGNHQGRFKEKEEAERNRDIAVDETMVRTRSPKKNWPPSKQRRSLTARLVHLRKKRAKYEARDRAFFTRFMKTILDGYAKEIEQCEQALAKLEGLPNGKAAGC